MARDLKFIEAYRVTPWKHLIEQTYKSKTCTDAAAAYTANMMRTHMLTRLPGIPFKYGKIYRDAQRELCEERGYAGEIDMTDEKTHKRLWELFDAIGNRDSDERNIQHDEDSTIRFERICKDGSIMHQALETVLQSVVIQSYIAFEVMVESVWEGAFSEGLTSIVRPTEKQMKREQLGFGSRKRIRAAYEFVFTKDNAQILSVLKDVSIDALAATRNVFIHSAGVIDEDFISHSEFSTVLAPIRALGEGKKVELTGVLLRELVDPVIEKGYALLLEMDRWIGSNP